MNLPVPTMIEPASDDIAAMGVAPSEFTDFIKAWKVITAQTEGVSFKKACENAGINVRAAYNDKWTELFSKAMQLVGKDLLVAVKNTRNLVYQAFEDMVRRQLKIATTGSDDKAATAAFEVIYGIFVAGKLEEAVQDNKEMEYLRRRASNPNFNPMSPMVTAEAGSTVIINSNPPSAEEFFSDVDMPTSK